MTTDKNFILLFLAWIRKEDTQENAERYFGYTDEDMLNEFIEINGKTI